MMNQWLRAALGAGIWTICTSAVWAQESGNDLPYRFDRYHVTHDIHADGTSTTTYEWRQTPLKQDELENVKSVQYSFSTSIEKGEFLEAYTLKKKEGRTVIAPPGNYQLNTRNGREGASPLYSDRSSISVMLPEVEVGDTVHIKYRVTEKEPMFPGKVSFTETLSPFDAYDDVQMRVRYPESLGMRFESHFFKQQATETLADGRSETTWTYSNPSPHIPTPEKDSGIWAPDEIPVVLASNFENYEAIVNAYKARAYPKAAVTPRIQMLSDKIVAGVPPGDRAKKLYEWVSKELTYGGNCIGTGSVVPRDLDTVLDNHMGDCKDHATLLQALLTAQGIASEQVLVNAGNTFTLPKTPVVSMVNHVMNYLPDANLYLDATAKQVAYGLLPRSAYAKPVLHVGTFRPNARIPHLDPKTNGQVLNYSLKVANTGAATGHMSVDIEGEAAASTRKYMSELTPQQQRDWVKRRLVGYGLKGKGVLDLKDANDQALLLSTRYSYEVTFEVDDILRNDGTNGSMPLVAALSTPWSTYVFADRSDNLDVQRPVNCGGFWSKETLTFDLPKSMQVTSMPRKLMLQQSLLDYSASYEQKGTRLVVKRNIADKTPVSVCPPDMTAAFNKQVAALGRNLSTPLIYRFKR